MRFVAEFLGVAYDNDKCVSPVFGYAITEDKVKAKNSLDFGIYFSALLFFLKILIEYFIK
jgi:hypothetical protein